MTLYVILRFCIPKYHDTFVYVIEGNAYFDVFVLMQTLTQ